MKITIDYESSWRNSFLEGSNNEPIPKKGRKFVGSIEGLKNEKNYLRRDICLDTVMGVLNRLIGDQRKLYQSRASNSYYFEEIEPKIAFYDKPRVINSEMTYIRNMSGNTDKNAFVGAVKDDDPIFNSDYSQKFWSVLDLEFDSLCEFIISGEIVSVNAQLSPLIVCRKLEDLGKLKVVKVEGRVELAKQVLDAQFPDIVFADAANKVKPAWFYFSALYLQLCRLEDRFDMSSAKTQSGVIKGISKKNFTKKNFLGHYSTGGEKKIWGNPYIHEEFVRGEGKIRHLMTKASGQLEIDIDVDKSKGQEIIQLIENAGVSSFYLGKKGLAYVSKIRA